MPRSEQGPGAPQQPTGNHFLESARIPSHSTGSPDKNPSADQTPFSSSLNTAAELDSDVDKLANIPGMPELLEAQKRYLAQGWAWVKAHGHKLETKQAEAEAWAQAWALGQTLEPEQARTQALEELG